LFSLQRGPGVEQLCSARDRGLPVTELIGAALSDAEGWGEVAALIQNMDLVISIDSAPAHLAGALGVNVWVLLSKISDWRWLLDRHDSPWYPTMRLFRQKTLADWLAPLHHMCSELQTLSSSWNDSLERQLPKPAEVNVNA
jgi:ADP-heptose:LPS heptosyltransferase